jgi:hypothetical protein
MHHRQPILITAINFRLKPSLTGPYGTMAAIRHQRPQGQPKANDVGRWSAICLGGVGVPGPTNLALRFGRGASGLIDKAGCRTAVQD